MEPRARDTLPAQALNAWNSGNRNLKEGTHFLPQGSTPLPGRQKCGLVVSPGGEGNGLWGRASASFFPVCSPCPSEIRKSRSPGQLVGGGLASLGSLTALHPLWTSLSPLSPGSPLSQPLGPPFCPLGPRASDCRRAFALTLCSDRSSHACFFLQAFIITSEGLSSDHPEQGCSPDLRATALQIWPLLCCFPPELVAI